MAESRLRDLRELAHEYYMGKLSYEIYRSKRTQLLDDLTREEEDDTNDSKTRRMPSSTAAKQAPVHQQPETRWNYNYIVILMMFVAIIVLIWNIL